jgi:O-antigen/teichoic acid export membrane protein
MSLAKKAVHGLAWVALSTFIIRILDFLAKLVLARLLLPSDFGLVAIGLLVVNTLHLFQNLGFGAALIYKKDDREYRAANTAFILIPLSGTILFVLAYFSSSFVATFFNNTTVEPIVKVLAFTFIVSSLGVVPSKLLEKELEFKKKVLPETLSVLGYAVVAITLAFLGYGVWSLVFGQVASAILSVALIWMVSEWRPTFTFDKSVARELFSYGKHILGASVVVFLVTNIDDAVVGRMLGMSALGFYTVAYMISNLPATHITHLVSKVMFPTYSKLQDDREALKNAYLKTLKYVSMFSIPASFGIFIIAPDFVRVVLGEKWVLAVVPIQILVFFGLFRSLTATAGTVFTAVGKPDIVTRLVTVRLVFMLVALYPFTLWFGLLGVCLVVLLPSFFLAPYAFSLASKILNMPYRTIYEILRFPFLSSAGMLIVLYSVKYSILDLSSIVELLLFIFIGIGVYSMLLFMLSKGKIIKETREILANFKAK